MSIINERLQLGFHTGGKFFIDKRVKRRMKTAKNQSGFIKLAAGQAKEKLGTRWDIGTDAVFKAKNFSIVTGYALQKKEKNILAPKDTMQFPPSIVNAGAPGAFTFHLIHLMFDYTFRAHIKNKKIIPNLILYADIPIAGKDIFNTTMIGGGIRLNFNW